VKQLIVNADDFGLTESVSRGILHAHQNGIVTSATLLANGIAWEMSIAASKQAPRLGIGVHLNLSEGIPVSPTFRVQTVVDAKGRLHLTPTRLWKAVVQRQVRLGDIETELRAQVMRVVEAGIKPTHLDGHLHIHILPRVSEIVVRLAREFGIVAIRCPLEPIRSILRPMKGDVAHATSKAAVQRRAVALAVSFFARRFRKRLEKAGLMCPAHFNGTSRTGLLDLRGVKDILLSLPDGISELMCHPGYLDADLVAVGGRLLAQREAELLALTSPVTIDLTVRQGIQLATYQELANSRLQHETAA
jgi:predicted glycoside hydrolase/deacetylase ChbG (UPF0249 family)